MKTRHFVHLESQEPICKNISGSPWFIAFNSADRDGPMCVSCLDILDRWNLELDREIHKGLISYPPHKAEKHHDKHYMTLLLVLAFVLLALAVGGTTILKALDG